MDGEMRGIQVIQHNTNETKTDGVSAKNHDLNDDTIFPDRVHLKQWEDPDNVDARHIKVK